jgi:hypothetical protein
MPAAKMKELPLTFHQSASSGMTFIGGGVLSAICVPSLCRITSDRVYSLANILPQRSAPISQKRLAASGVPDKIIQRILRHGDVAVTQKCYIKTPDEEATAAMQKFERFLEYAPNMHLSGNERTHLM